MFGRLASGARTFGLMVATLALGGGIAMAAQSGPITFNPAADSTVSPSASPSDSVSPSDSPSDSATPTPTDSSNAPAPAPTTSCPADVKNHGQYVSSVAHSAPKGPGHGAAVAAAAQSDCGKPSAGASSTDSPDPSESPEAPDSPEPTDSEAPATHDSTTKHGHGHGHHG